jgi:hypothetical protein
MGFGFFRKLDKYTRRSGPNEQYARKLAAMQELLLKLDSKIDAARTTLLDAAARSNPLIEERERERREAMERQRVVDGDKDRSDRSQATLLNIGSVGAFDDDLTSQIPSSADHRSMFLYDQRSSGYKALTKEEFMKLQESAGGRAVSEEETDLLFDLLDTDSDGKLHLNEVVDMGAIPSQRRRQ